MPRATGGLMKFAIFVLAVGAFYLLVIHEDRVVLPPGVKAADAPVQEAIDPPVVVYADDEFKVAGFATFALQAKVLGRERYRNDREAALSPIDLALGWQRMSDQAVVDEIDISQRGRWYHWRTRDAPIPLRDIERCSANMHMLPKNDRVREALVAVRTGEIVSLKGYRT